MVDSPSFTMRNVDRAKQLAGGIYDVENNQWRWTAGDFGVVLATPPGASTRGADLVFDFFIPDTIFDRTGPLTLTAFVNDTEVGARNYGTAGTQRFSVMISPEYLKQSPLGIGFHFDQYVPSGVLDPRELGVVATAVSLQSK